MAKPNIVVMKLLAGGHKKETKVQYMCLSFCFQYSLSIMYCLCYLLTRAEIDLLQTAKRMSSVNKQLVTDAVYRA